MHHWKKIVICVVLLLLVCSRGAFAETLVAGVNDWQPWMRTQGAEADGIMVDIFTDAVQRAGYEPVVVVMPHKRRNVIEWGRSIHVEPGVLPEWRREYEEVSVYTIPFVTTRDIVLAKKGVLEPATSVEDFHGKRLGVTLGYYYPDGFSEAFESSSIIRDDSPAGPNLVQKLQLSRVHGAIMDKHEASYWISQLSLKSEDFEFVYTFSLVSELRMRLHPDKAHMLPALNAALQEMLQEGAIRKIIASHLD